MHELSLAESMIDIVRDHADRQGFQTVNSILLSCGRLSCINPKALEFAFEVQARNTVAEGATLQIRLLPAALYCFSCENEREVQAHTGTCPDCGGHEVALTAGTESLCILELDVD